MTDDLNQAKLNLVIASKNYQLASSNWVALRNSEAPMAAAMHRMGIPKGQVLAALGAEIRKAEVLREARMIEFKEAQAAVADLEPDLNIAQLLSTSELHPDSDLQT